MNPLCCYPLLLPANIVQFVYKHHNPRFPLRFSLRLSILARKASLQTKLYCPSPSYLDRRVPVMLVVPEKTDPTSLQVNKHRHKKTRASYYKNKSKFLGDPFPPTAVDAAFHTCLEA